MGVRRGMMIPHISVALPDGLVWADGKTNWSNEKWLPEHLRSVPVPNMSEELIGGAREDRDVGMILITGRISVPGTPLTNDDPVTGDLGPLIVQR